MREEDEGSKFEVVIPEGVSESETPKKMRLTKRTECVRCGKCCTGGGPALLKEDMRLFQAGVLSYDNTCTIRDGERVRSHGDGEIYESFMELVKVRNKDGKAECIFYQGDGKCGSYENRPAQCREYECWSANTAPGESPEGPAPGNVLEGLEKRGMTRRDLFQSVDALLKVIEKHEEKCSFRKLADAFDRVAKGEESAVEEIMEMLQYDTYARPFLVEKLNVPSGALDLVLGNSLIDAVNEFGFKVAREGDEYILLPQEEREEQ